MTTWKTLALNRAELLEDELDAIVEAGYAAELAHFVAERPTEAELRAAVAQAERGAVAAAALQDLKQVRAEHGLSHAGEQQGGSERSHTWDELHRIETRIDGLLPVPDVVSAARRHAKERLTSERAERFEEDLEKLSDEASKRSLALQVITEAHAASAVRHEAERQQRRGLLVFAALLVAAAAVTVVLQWRAFPGNPLVQPPSGTSDLANWAVVALVMMFGMLGGGFSALMALYVNNTTYTDTYWFDPRPGLALIKISVGSWAAFFGVLGIGTDLVGGSYTFAALIITSFVFGYGQQLVTRLLDKKVEDMAPKDGS